MLEARLVFFYLGIEECSDEEWACRKSIFNIHDCASRLKLFQSMPGQERMVENLQNVLSDLQSRLEGSAFLQSVDPKKQKRFLKGNDAYLSSLEEIAARAGLDIETFRWLYKFMSSHVHGFPLSFYLVGHQERGRGLHGEVEEGYTGMLLTFITDFLVRATKEMKCKFSPNGIE